MTQFRVTIEVDNIAAFDAIRAAGDGGGAVGTRLAGVLLTPENISPRERLSLAAYGITIKAVERLPHPAPHPGAERGEPR